MASEQENKAAEFQSGDYVAWRYGSGEARGHVVEKLTHDRRLYSKTFKASQDEPRYLIRSAKSGKDVIRKPETLRKVEENEESDQHNNEGGESDEMSAPEDEGEKVATQKTQGDSTFS
eukprot:Gb_40008 [translate_table: standard]